MDDSKKRRLSTIRGKSKADENIKKSKVVVESEDESSSGEDSNNKLGATAKPKRKSMLTPATPLNNNNITIDDDQNNTSGITNMSSSFLLKSPNRKSVLTNQQISDLYSNCIKLSNENKINQKNTWNLDLIDNIDKVLENHNKSTTESVNFQAVSCTLEASVKIYSSRVDSVHNETYKILGGLSRSDSDAQHNEDGDKDQEDNEGHINSDGEQGEDGDSKSKEAKEKKKSGKKKSGVNTLETNLDNITIKKFDLQFMVDPLFGKTSAAFDEGGARGLLLNHLSIYDDCRLVFDSLDAIKSTKGSTQSQGIHKTVDISHWKSLFNPSKTKNLEICPTFSNFNQWSEKPTNAPELDEHDELETSIGGIDLNINDHEEEEDEDLHLNHNDLDSNDEENENHQDDNTKFFTNDFNINHDDVDEHYEQGNGINTDDMDDNGDILKSNNDDWEEYNFLPVIQNWSGLDHWKFQKKPVTKKSADGGSENSQHEGSDSEDTTTSSTKKKKATKKKAFFLDFDAPPPPDSLFEPPKKQTTIMSAAAIKKASETSTILPPDIHFDIKRLSRLFNKPQSIIPPMSRREEFIKKKFGVSSSQTQNENDTGFNVGPDFDFPSSQMFDDKNSESTGEGRSFNFDKNDNDDDDSGFNEPGIEDNDDQFESSYTNNYDSNIDSVLNTTTGELNEDGTVQEIGINNGKLVAEPNKVQRLEIGHNRVAKRINIESLSSSIWKCIDKYPTATNSKLQPQKSITKDLNESFDNSLDSSIQPEKSETIPNDFKHLIQELKDSKQITPESSISLIFFCVLRLANEKNLKLNQTDINNFFINNTVQPTATTTKSN
ncbi:hypothetical protein DLAC_02579 [Tieghemostelium lacteum]|uniref:Condensin complex subunit 2 n=1 Tax=Tieghemostelium lacteum TaxID=361077 RepID=A0A152A2T2_TIELA|nr:hypothetical protein DLAC_02579 [Tieghemostelium lacteum]|eukprot:KYR00563.1 hypothetical protein DLAC_02579 [Tieghemostelium lacteum]